MYRPIVTLLAVTASIFTTSPRAQERSPLYPIRVHPTPAEGEVLPDGFYDLTATLYASVSNEEPLWSERHERVPAAGGVLELTLGELVPIAIDVDEDTAIGIDFDAPDVDYTEPVPLLVPTTASLSNPIWEPLNMVPSGWVSATQYDSHPDFGGLRHRLTVKPGAFVVQDFNPNCTCSGWSVFFGFCNTDFETNDGQLYIMVDTLNPDPQAPPSELTRPYRLICHGWAVNPAL